MSSARRTFGKEKKNKTNFLARCGVRRKPGKESRRIQGTCIGYANRVIDTDAHTVLEIYTEKSPIISPEYRLQGNSIGRTG